MNDFLETALTFPTLPWSVFFGGVRSTGWWQPLGRWVTRQTARLTTASMRRTQAYWPNWDSVGSR
ncbi:hypothetical protein ACFP81_14295 [Deinococcus lacus]|uniref:Transposase n=1 Tax=Deinococcus lacus TaxID=392561 RepID=A0ABW1YH99_9DEIO